jgi:hypothetical protein
MEYREGIRRQNRGDRSVDTGNFNALVDKVNALGRSMLDPNKTKLVRQFGSHIQVSTSTGVRIPKKSLHLSINANVVSNLAGKIVIHGDQKVPVPADSVTLSGSTSIVYVEMTWASKAVDLKQATTPPDSGPTLMIWELAKYTATGTGYRILDGDLYWEGDIHIGTAQRAS